MTVVDTSVVVAILKEEDDAATWIKRLSRYDDLALPASCYLEAVMVLSSTSTGRVRLEGLISTYGIAIIGSDARQARLAADAFARFGRGSGHAAKLNFGDCLSYAAAAAHEAPLMFKGDDFPHADLRPAL